MGFLLREKTNYDQYTADEYIIYNIIVLIHNIVSRQEKKTRAKKLQLTVSEQDLALFWVEHMVKLESNSFYISHLKQ